MKAIWSGHITFGLISIPVGLHAAVESSEHVSFRLLHRKDMAPIQLQEVLQQGRRRGPQRRDREGLRGLEEKVRASSRRRSSRRSAGELGEGDRSIEVLQFVDFGVLQPSLLREAVLRAPQKGGEKAYAVLRDALADARRVGITRFFLRTKPLLAALIPGKRGAVARGAAALRGAPRPRRARVPSPAARAAEVKMAKLLIDQMSRRNGIRRSTPTSTGRRSRNCSSPSASSPSPPRLRAGKKEAEVVDLMEALRRSIGEKGGRAKAKRSGGARRAGAA